MGGRGVGKTTFLLRTAQQFGADDQHALYVSADNLYFLEHGLFDLVDDLYKTTDVRLLCIDEIHKYDNWQQEVKNITDTYCDFKVLFSGSSAIDIVRAKFDLSRRVTLYPLHGFLLREYVDFQHDVQLTLIGFDDLIQQHLTLVNDEKFSKILKYFNDYLRFGYYPFLYRSKHESEKYQLLENSVQKTIYEDIATLKTLNTSTLQLQEKLYKYIVISILGEYNASKLARYLNKDFNAISERISDLQQAGLIRFIYPPKTGKAMLRNPQALPR